MDLKYLLISLILVLELQSILGPNMNDDCDPARPPKVVKELCDENSIMMHLARLSVSSPEEIVILLTTGCMADTCEDVTDVLARIEESWESCIPLPSTNLYMRLRNGLVHFHNTICLQDECEDEDDLRTFLGCFKELRDDFIDCEGPADWYERTNKAEVCQHYQDVLNCYYVRTALLCGLKPARMIREFMVGVCQHVLPFKCPIPRSPRVKNPMGATASGLRATRLLYYFAIIIMTIYTYLIKILI